MTNKKNSQPTPAITLSGALSDLSHAQIEIAELKAERERLTHELSDALNQISIFEDAVQPRLKSILTLRPLRFALKQRNMIKRRKANHNDEPNALDAPGQFTNSGKQISITTPPQKKNWGKLGIAVFGHTRSDCILNTLESLARQDALHITHVFIDGDQGSPTLRSKIDQVYNVANMYPVKHVHHQRGAFGFRKMMLIAGQFMAQHYSKIIFLEDDCFPANNAVAEFDRELTVTEQDPGIFSIYGHPFLIENENQQIGRFQSWGWATTSEKLKPIWKKLKECYLMSEPEYLSFVQSNLTEGIKRTIDVTPGRQPSETLSKFFAWDETVCLLTALTAQRHKRSDQRLIYNCGAGLESTHFKDLQLFRRPPFNMIGVDEVWTYY